jgi:putative transposase
MSDRRRIADDELFAHFVTFSCHKRRRLLDEDQPKRIVLGQLNDQLRRQSARWYLERRTVGVPIHWIEC